MPPSTPSQSRLALSGFRARAMRRTVKLGWLLIAAVLFLALREGVLTSVPVAGSLITVAITVGAMSQVDWEQAFTTIRGDVLVWSGATVVIAALSLLASLPELNELVFPLYFGVLMFSGAVAGEILHWVMTASVVAAVVFMPYAYGDPRPPGELVVPVLSLLIVSVATRALTREFASESRRGLDHLRELQDREEDFKRLYEVSRTMAVGDSLQTALPELVGRIGRYLNAEVGLVLLYNAGRRSLDVVSPIWTSGHALEVADYRLNLRAPGEIQKVFLSGKGAVFSGLGDHPEQHGLMGELGVRTAVVAPLRVEHQTIGVIVVADRTSGDFTRDDLDELVSLAGPAALVLAQLERYQQAAETGKRMEELARMKTDFVSVVSHELRTPLTSIIGSLDTIARPELSPENRAAQELLASARRQATRLRRLIEDLLMASQIENRSLPNHPQNLLLGTVLREIVSEIPHADRLAVVEVRPLGASLKADPDHLRRIVLNLVQNAIKYAPNSQIEVVAERIEHEVTVSVIDHGPGIPPEERQTVFERFTQLEPSQIRSQGGTGLGLSIVKGLAESMGGSIQISETPGGGSTFTITLPAAPRMVATLEDSVAMS